MFSFDLVVKNAVVVTASDEVRCDIGIKHGVVKALGQDLPTEGSTRIIDAEGAYVTVSLSCLSTEFMLTNRTL